MGRGLRWYTLGYFIILELMLVAAVLYWPNFRENVGALKLMAPIPVMKDMVARLEAGGAVAYVTGQQFFKGCNTLGTAASVLFAVGAVAGEAHRGTLEILLARPFSRSRVLATRWLGGALAMSIPIFLSSATIPWLAGFVDEQLDYGPLMLCSLHQTIFLLAIYTATFFFSTRGTNPTKIAMGMLFFTTFAFAIYMVERVTHWSLFRLTDIDDFLFIYSENTLDWKVVGPLLAFSALVYGAAEWSFRRRLP